MHQLKQNALASVQQGQLELAKQQLQELAGLESDDPEIWFMLGAISGQQGNIEDCISCCRRALSIRPDYPDARFNLGLALLNGGQPLEARESFRELITLQADNKAAMDQFKLADLQVQQSERRTITIHGGVKISVPASIQLQVPYVLTELEDWFEDEVHFVRRLAEVSEYMIDIGANYGVYTLSMASLAGPEGRILAFEPASETADYLEKSIQLNGYTHVCLKRIALSDRTGSARLSLSANTESNSLVTDMGEGRFETVELATLDRVCDSLDWARVDFIKLDAEGEESRVIQGGQHVFESQSPLVMFELRHGQQVNWQLIDQFKGLGYGIYRLVPGLNLIAPVENPAELDTRQLNLFACKADRAAELEALGLLASGKPDCSDPGGPDDQELRAFYTAFPAGEAIIARTLDCRESPPASSGPYLRALKDYIMSRREVDAASARYNALLRASKRMDKLVDETTSLCRLMTAARIKAELGLCSQAIDLIKLVVKRCKRGVPLALDEPFIPVSRSCERFGPKSEWRHWCLAAALEEKERLQHLTPYAAGVERLPELEKLRQLGDQSAQMERRYQLIRLRHGLQREPVAHPVLAGDNAGSLNPAFWGVGKG